MTPTTWEERQRAFMERLGRESLSDLETGTIVALPSATFPVSELCKITAIQHYEERMLFVVLLLRRPQLRVVYATSLPVDPGIVDYYLSFLPDPDDARRRLRLVAVDDDGPLPLTEKLLERPDVVERLRASVEDPDDAYVLPFNVTSAEHRLSDALGLPFYGPHPRLAQLGSKSGSRKVARRAGVAVLPGAEDLRSLEAVEGAIAAIRAVSPEAEAVVVKLNDGFSGQGNAIVELSGPTSPLPESNGRFCAGEESWPSFAAKIAKGGAIVEQLLRPDAMASPSVQLRISPAGTVEVVSTHDQILGGPDNQVYLGCRFPAQWDYRLAIQEAGMRVGRILADEGVIGSFGIDFIIDLAAGEAGIYLSEINLRMGGTTHPFWMARLATAGTYDALTGELMADGRPKSYVATDNLKSEHLAGRHPVAIIREVAGAGLGYDAGSRTGATLHLLGALPGFGKMGVTCIADSPEEADKLYQDLVDTIQGRGAD
ncbi:MAG TPA: peptide ligase PGM1-related protein [Acidimicrobiales bacterium]|nr:peptide ligase PGM1-related protein [Acidimicrobiales bacterium]